MEWINFRHLYAFWAVCRHGGFQKAAKKIHVSQSAISDQVSQLEAYLEEQLLQRSTRSLKITPRGSELLKYADDIFLKSSEINHVFRDKNESSVTNNLRIGMVGGISRNLIYRMVMEATMGTDENSVNIIDGSFEELSGLLKSFELDVILTLEIPRKKDSLTLAHKTVETSPVCLAGKPEIIRKLKKEVKKIREFRVFAFNHPFEKDPLKVMEDQFNIKANAPLITDDISLLRFFANSGQGLALIPEIGIQEDLQSRQLSRVRLPSLESVDFYGLYMKQSSQKDKIEEFLTHF